MWCVFFVNLVTDGSLNAYAIEPRSVPGLRGIALGPFIHSGWGQIGSNTLAFLPLSALVVLRRGLASWGVLSAVVVVLGGLASWAAVEGPGGAPVTGCRGWNFGMLANVLIVAMRSAFPRRCAPAAMDCSPHVLEDMGVGTLALAFYCTLGTWVRVGEEGRPPWQVDTCFLSAGAFAGEVHVRLAVGRYGDYVAGSSSDGDEQSRAENGGHTHDSETSRQHECARTQAAGTGFEPKWAEGRSLPLGGAMPSPAPGDWSRDHGADDPGAAAHRPPPAGAEGGWASSEWGRLVARDREERGLPGSQVITQW
eukprot:CAMPEP_0185172594 /NCGR_PEP_ID=MMETSP1139-20130426/21775_1 /TAXON_ID=298111 /ORGANISM="Pavlova sp., Strain CCMP459" /LENGTH=308 /DNA_ID=CAMNT_0027738243 /DNA_START=29 /DNA_END=955 /DNA_ORIENTATION=-